jgi:hypothetical protein
MAQGPRFPSGWYDHSEQPTGSGSAGKLAFAIPAA